MFILDDPEASALPLPSEYGVDDVPVIVQDKSFDGVGQLDEEHSIFSNVGTMGDKILVNGTPSPYLDVTTQAVRLRLLNGSGGRVFNFTFDDHRASESSPPTVGFSTPRSASATCGSLRGSVPRSSSDSCLANGRCSGASSSATVAAGSLAATHGSTSYSYVPGYP